MEVSCLYHDDTVTVSLVNVGLHGGISPELIVTQDTRVNVTLDETDQIIDVWCISFS